MNKTSKMRPSQLPGANDLELLRTKLTPPRLRGPLVFRKELLARLEESQERRVTLLSAAAGFGKTTLVRSWMTAEGGELSPVAWVSLDKGDNDPVRFWRYVLTACQALSPDLGRQSLNLLHNSRQSAFETVLILFLNELAQFAGRGLLVLEDYHHIVSPKVHETLAFLIDYLPETLRVVLITRHDPPLPLARWRAHDELYELRATDLRFSLEEIRMFLQQVVPFSFDAEIVTRLNERTEGWVAGLRLLTLALQGRQEQCAVEQVLATFTGSHQHILEYLVADVLSVQPPHLQDFLLQTSLLGRVNGSLCDLVTGRDDSAQILAQLDAANLFLYPLDGSDQWYRYHALFAEAMQHEARRRFREEKLHTLYHQASLWYEAHALLPEAIDAELASRNFARAAELMERLLEHANFQNEYYTFYYWLELFPEADLQTHPELCLIYASTVLFLTDRYSAVTIPVMERPLQMAERIWREQGKTEKLGEVEALRSLAMWWQGAFSEAFRRARHALELLPEDSWLWRGACLINVGVAELYDGRPERARQIFLEARTANEAAENNYALRASLFLICEACQVQGELHLAAQLYHRLLVDAEASKDFTDVLSAFYRLAALAYEWNDLEAAENWLTRALQVDQRFMEDEARVSIALLQARLQCARGENVSISQNLTTLAARMQKWPHLLRAIYGYLACFALEAGDLVAARQYIATVAQHSISNLYIHREQDALLNARLLIAQEEGVEALRQLSFWYKEAQERGRRRIVLEILLLQALAYASRKEHSLARRTLVQALAEARPEGYQRLFLDEGEAMNNLLRVTLSEISEEQAAYVRTLLLAYARRSAVQQAPFPLSVAHQGVFLEPLSPQEQRVLRLLAAGCSNPEIARELVVSVNTVKTQVQSIYHKLNVNSRQEARETARRLRLL